MSEKAREQRGGLTRKRFIDWLLGTSLGGFVLAVLYPVARYWIPPALAESAVNSVILPFKAADVAANTGRIFKFGSKPGILIKTPSGECGAFTRRVHPSVLHRAVSRGHREHLVRLPQRPLRPQRPQHRRAAAETPGGLQRERPR